MIRDFNQALLALATVVGAWFGAAALRLDWAFWTLFGLALGWALLRWTVPRTRRRLVEYRDLIQRGRDHGRMLKVAGEYQAMAEELAMDKQALHLELTEQYSRGVLEGRRRAIGELLASRGEAELEPQAVGLQDGELLLAAQSVPDNPPLVGSRWLLTVKGMNSVKAVCVVREVTDTSSVLLCVDQVLDEPQVTRLREQAETSADFPPSLELRVRPFTELQDLEQEISS